MKTDKHSVLVRIPEWTDPRAVTCKANGIARVGSWVGKYLNLGKANAGDRIVVEFPIKQRVVGAQLTAWRKEDFPKQCRVTVKGNTVIEMNPRMSCYPIVRQEKYRTDTAPMRKVTRFVSTEEFTM